MLMPQARDDELVKDYSPVPGAWGVRSCTQLGLVFDQEHHELKSAKNNSIGSFSGFETLFCHEKNGLYKSRLGNVRVSEDANETLLRYFSGPVI